MNFRSGLVALQFPSRYFVGYHLDVVDPTIQALPVHNANLDLGHVEPTGVLGRAIALLEDFRMQKMQKRRRDFFSFGSERGTPDRP